MILDRGSGSSQDVAMASMPIVVKGKEAHVMLHLQLWSLGFRQVEMSLFWSRQTVRKKDGMLHEDEEEDEDEDEDEDEVT